MVPGTHGSTFGGNPLATASALAVIETIETKHLGERVTQLGATMKSAFESALADNPAVVEIRGCGLMLGIQLDRPCAQLVSDALDNGLLINVTAGSVIRLLPPFILSDDEAEQIVSTVVKLINRFTTAA